MKKPIQQNVNAPVSLLQRLSVFNVLVSHHEVHIFSISVERTFKDILRFVDGYKFRFLNDFCLVVKAANFVLLYAELKIAGNYDREKSDQQQSN